MADGAAPGSAWVGSYDFFVSYVPADEKWASWIAWQLEEQLRLSGERQPKVFLRAWSVVPGMNEAASRQLALTASARIVPVLSPDYLVQVGADSAEWLAVWADDPDGTHRKLIPVRVRECRAEGLLRQIHYIDLVDRDAASATDVLLSGINASLEGRAKPTTAPPFPGLGRPTANGNGTGPPFPGVPVLVGEPPAVPPNWFQDRTSEVEDLERRLGDGHVAAVSVVGREGIGKTAMVHQLRERIRAGRSPLQVHGLVYLSAHGFWPVAADRVIDSLVQLFPKHEAVQLAAAVRQPLPWVEKLVVVLDALRGREAVVVIDAVEELLDRASEIADPALRELVDHLLSAENPRVRLLLVGRRAAQAAARRFPGSTYQRALEEGLPEREAVDLLRAMDTDSRLNFDALSAHDVGRLHRLTRGWPRTLELAYAVLNVPGYTVDRLLELMQRADGTDMTVHLLTAALAQLSAEERRVLQALAVYGRPVPARAVNHLLRDDASEPDSRPALERLRPLRLVRSDGDCFFVPPTAERDYVFGLIRLEAAASARVGMVRRTPEDLLDRAAGYFAGARMSEPRRIDDLRPQLSEIELRLRAGEHQAAFDLMAEVDDRYLLGWGAGSALVPSLHTLLSSAGIPGKLEIDAESMLARALMQQEDHRAAADHLVRALDLASGASWAGRRIVLREQLTEAYLHLDELRLAVKHSRRACADAIRQVRCRAATTALADLAMCRAREGDFTRALRHFRMARLLLRRFGTDADRIQLPTMLIGEAWTYGQLGKFNRARDELREARRRASELGNRRLEGMCLSGEAELALDETNLRHAVELVEEAAAIGVRNGDRALCRVAMEILAEVRLCQGDLDAAERAADIARRNHCSVTGFALVGLVAYRQGRDQQARTAFQEGRDEAERRRGPNERSFQLLDAYGVVACGLALLDDPAGLPTALYAYQAARAITTEPGAVGRVQLLLAQFGPRADPAILNRVRAAAKGECRADSRL